MGLPLTLQGHALHMTIIKTADLVPFRRFPSENRHRHLRPLLHRINEVNFLALFGRQVGDLTLAASKRPTL